MQLATDIGFLSMQNGWGLKLMINGIDFLEQFALNKNSVFDIHNHAN